jgi:dTDP-glucose pyrophosphorylase
MTISVMPMAGDGTRYRSIGNEPKPLSTIDSMPMFYWAMEHVVADTKIFVVKDRHVSNYSIDRVIKDFFPDAIILVQQGKVEGQLMSVMLAKEFLQTSEELVILDCDMSLKIDHNRLQYLDCDAALGTFFSQSKEYAYVLKKEGAVVDIKEKNQISNEAVGGVFYWKRSNDFLQYATASILKENRVREEYYVSSVYDEAIKNGAVVKTIMSGFGYDLSTEIGRESFLWSRSN